MGKLYTVTINDTEDGGHLLAAAFFQEAKEARNEFKRVKSIIFDGYHDDQPRTDVCWYHHEYHFTYYENGEGYVVRLDVIETGAKIEHWLLEDKKRETCYRSERKDEECDYGLTIASIFDSVVKEASSGWRYEKGFKYIYNEVKRSLFDSFVRCEYESRKGKQRMKYFVRSKEGNDLTVVVVKDKNNCKYSWHYE